MLKAINALGGHGQRACRRADREPGREPGANLHSLRRTESDFDPFGDVVHQLGNELPVEPVPHGEDVAPGSSFHQL